MNIKGLDIKVTKFCIAGGMNPGSGLSALMGRPSSVQSTASEPSVFIMY